MLKGQITAIWTSVKFHSYDSGVSGENIARPEGNQVQESEGGGAKNNLSHATPSFSKLTH